MAVQLSIPHAIPYQGSKRQLASRIISWIPKNCNRIIEPFCGSSAVTLAALHSGLVETSVIGDLNQPLVRLWEQIESFPDKLADRYDALWHGQIGNEREYYDIVRSEFNRTQKPELFLYLLARCVKASVRYNSNGEFNQGPDNRRLGMRPDTMRDTLLRVSKLIRDRVSIRFGDYREISRDVNLNDIVYMDPPYQGLNNNRTSRYIRGFSHYDFVAYLEELNRKRVSFIVSYDGKTGAKNHGEELPDSLGLTRLELFAGVSTQSTLLKRSEDTYESLYLSQALTTRIEANGKALSRRSQQMQMFAQAPQS